MQGAWVFVAKVEEDLLLSFLVQGNADFSWTQLGRRCWKRPQLTGLRNYDPHVDLAERPLPLR